MTLRLKSKPGEGKMGSKIVSKIFSYFNYDCLKEDSQFFLEDKLRTLLEE